MDGQKKMKVAKVLNPSSFIGQLSVYVVAFLAGALSWIYIQEPCPPTTSINIEQKNKAKRGSSVTTDISAIINPEANADCVEWLRGLSKKDIKSLKK